MLLEEHERSLELKLFDDKLELTGNFDTNIEIFNSLDLSSLVALTLVNKSLNKNLGSIMQHLEMVHVCSKTLVEIMNKNDENREVAEHLFVEMYYGLKKRIVDKQ